jgi:hypothetical protein
MKTFTLTIPTQDDNDGDKIIVGEGNTIDDARHSLFYNLRLAGIDLTEDQEIEMTEYLLVARDTPNTVIEKSNFSLPEENYSVLFDDDAIDPLAALKAIRARLLGEESELVSPFLVYCTIDRFWDVKRIVGKFFNEKPETYNR